MIALSRFLIVEDELLIAETISDFLKKEGCKVLEIVESVDEAINYMENNKVDFVLTDIALGNGRSGIDLGNLLNTKYKIPFIYITSYADKTTIDKAKHTRPSAYVVKPFKKEDLLIAIELALFNSTANTNNTSALQKLIVKEGRAIVLLNCDDIKWMETDGNYTTINLVDAKRRVVRIPISELQQQLPSQQFVRIHKSYLINKEHITEVRTNSVIIQEYELPIGRAYQAFVSDFFK